MDLVYFDKKNVWKIFHCVLSKRPLQISFSVKLTVISEMPYSSGIEQGNATLSNTTYVYAPVKVQNGKNVLCFHVKKDELWQHNMPCTVKHFD